MLQDSEDSNNNLYSNKKNKNEIKAGRIFLSKTKQSQVSVGTNLLQFVPKIIATYSLAPVSYGPRYDLPEQRSLDTLDRETKPRELASGGGKKKKPQKSHGDQGSMCAERLLTHLLSTSRGLDL